MKLISLNTWGGKHFDELINFIKKHPATDLFCFQEIYNTSSGIKQYKDLLRANLLAEIKNILPHFRVLYFPVLDGFDNKASKTNFDLHFGLAIFVKKSITINSYKNYFIYRDENFKFLKKDFSNLATPLQKIQFTVGEKTFSVFSFHGTPAPAAKKDTIKRLAQCRKIKKIIDRSSGAKILVGDFNLSKNTKSIKILEKDMINLIKEIDIKATRSKLSPFYGKSNFQKFADYTFVSPEIEVKSFIVPDVKISDHLPMILEFN